MRSYAVIFGMVLLVSLVLPTLVVMFFDDFLWLIPVAFVAFLIWAVVQLFTKEYSDGD